MEIDIDRFIEVEFGKGQLVVALTEAVPGQTEEKFAVMISTRTPEMGDNASAGSMPTSGLLLIFPTKAQARRVEDALMDR